MGQCDPIPIRTSQKLADEYGVAGANQYTKEAAHQNDALAKPPKANENLAKEVDLQNANQPKTSEVLGSEYGVHKSTIIRNANFAKVIDILPEEVKHDVLSGEEKISRTMTDAILDFDKPTQKKFLKEKNGITFLTIWRRNFEP